MPFSRIHTLTLFILSLALGVTVSGQLFAKTFLGVESERITRIIDLGYNMDPAMQTELAALRRDYPDSIVPNLIELGEQYWLQDYTEIDPELSKAFEMRLKEVIDETSAYAKRNREDVDAEFALAMLQLLHAKYHIDKGRMFAAFMRQRAPMKVMKRIVREYPEYHDAKLGIGLANCYLSEAPGFLKPLAILMRYDADLEKGLALLEEARAGGVFAHVDATYYLAAVKMEVMEDPNKARLQMKELTDRYSNNPRFQLLMAGLERQSKHFKSANDRVQKLLEGDVIGRFPHMKMHAFNHLYWSSNESGRHEIAVTAVDRAIAYMEANPNHLGWLPWAINAKGEGYRGLGQYEEAIAVFNTVESGNESAYNFAQRRIAEIREAQAKNR